MQQFTKHVQCKCGGVRSRLFISSLTPTWVPLRRNTEEEEEEEREKPLQELLEEPKLSISHLDARETYL